jgi:MoaA/NifB/PqqE/SkfB family radical SAM enzyme|tara:strand:- start:26870 stop:27991 length:1122 start_codon:yes stop_codon:yes gene_type:complete
MIKWEYNKINALHIEPSSLCNAACPGCTRHVNYSPNVNPDLILTSINIENFQKWFPLNFTKKIKRWLFCGSQGDPLACPDIYKILEYVCNNSVSRVQLNTNGGLRNPKFFRKLGNLFKNSVHNHSKIDTYRYIVFSIDGLEDTNHLYRRNVVWKKLEANLAACAETGANIHWDFLRFKHNNHQIDEARLLAEKYGVSLMLKNPFGVENFAMPVLDKNFELEYYLEHHEKELPKMPAGGKFVGKPSPLPKKSVELKKDECIRCYSFDKLESDPNVAMQELYVSAQGKVYPCCLVGNAANGAAYKSSVSELHDQYKHLREKNNLHYFSLEQIINHTNSLQMFASKFDYNPFHFCYENCKKSQRRFANLFIDKKHE